MFRNQNFVTQIARQRGIDSQIRKDVARSVLMIVQNQTMMLIETAAKFAGHFKREELQFIDIQCALRQSGCSFVLQCQEDTFVKHDNSFVRKDYIIDKPDEYLSRQLNKLGRLAVRDEVKGRWVYLEGRVPESEQNINVKTLAQLKELRSKQIEQQHNNFNIIRDRQTSVLTKQQEDFLNRLLTSEMSFQEACALKHNILALFPFIVHYLLSSELSVGNVRLMLNLLKNIYVKDQLQFNAHQIISYLLAYQGICNLQVGRGLGALVLSLVNKYPSLHQISDFLDDNKSWLGKIKKLGWCLEMGGKVQMDGLNAALLQGDEDAFRFRVQLNGVIKGLPFNKDYQQYLEEGLAGLQPESYSYQFI